MNKKLDELARSTGFPPLALVSFANNGHLPKATTRQEDAYNGLAFLSFLETEVYFE